MSEEQLETDDATLRDRIEANPQPALVWTVGLIVLIAVEFGAVASTVMSLPWNQIVEFLPAAPGAAVLAGIGDRLADLPTLLSRDVIPNQGYHIPGEGWQKTFLGLSPAVAWLLRVTLIYAYTFVFLGWLWKGYNVFRTHYRYADWTPRDDMVDRFRTHRWGQFGLVIVVGFVVLAMFAPAIGPTTTTQNIMEPYEHEIEYYDESTGTVETTLVGMANIDSRSKGKGKDNVGPMSYDTYDRFHPFGTLPLGKDLFTFMASGARVSLFIGIVAMGLAGIIATSLALLTAYYKGLVDLMTVLASDSVQALPVLMIVILLSVVLQGTWIAGLYDGALVLALILAGVYWPLLWRAVRGPAFQVAEEEWIDAAKSYGQTPRATMKKHMAPYIIGYLLVYMSMSLGGVIISVAGLSFLGLGVNPPTPEWGQAVNAGQAYVATPSWHISFIPGVLIVLVVTAFNALGDGIRDALDPQSEGETGTGSEAAAAGGGGA